MKRRLLQEQHGVTSKKSPFFIVTAVKISNLTSVFYSLIRVRDVHHIINIIIPSQVSELFITL
jgi:hypothetical protein